MVEPHARAETSLRAPDIRWYRPRLTPGELERLSRRSDLRGGIQTGLHLGFLGITGAASFMLQAQGAYAAAMVLAWIHCAAFGFLGWSGAGHELLHRTVFKTRWLNEVFLILFSFLMWNNWEYHRASHVRHHRYTLYRSADGEFNVTQPRMTLAAWVWALTFDPRALLRALRITSENARNVVKGEWGGYLFPPGSAAREKVVRAARIILLGHLVLSITWIATGWWWMFLLTTLAPFMGSALPRCLALAQHVGLRADVPDHRQNSRTIRLPLWLEFFYWGMNYHVEHHLFPAVPFFRLRELSEQLRDDLPPPVQGLTEVVRLCSQPARETGST